MSEPTAAPEQVWTQATAEPWLRELLPEPVTRIEAAGGGVLLSGGEPGLVVLRLNPAAVRVAVFAQKWWGAKAVLVDETLVALPWGRLPTDERAAREVVGHCVQAAIALRKSRYFQCQRCAKPRPPEWLHANRAGPDPCQMCGLGGAAGA